MVMQVTSALADAGLLRQRRHRPVVVEARHRRPALGGDVPAVAVGDQAVRVARVADDQDAHVAGGVLGERLALADEDLAVHAEQVLALHARLAREGADEERPVDAVERLVRVVGDDDVLQRREAAVVAAPSRRLRAASIGMGLPSGVGISSSCRMTLRVRPEDLAGGQPGQHGVRHLPARPGHRHANRVSHASALAWYRLISDRRTVRLSRYGPLDQAIGAHVV